MKRFFLTVLAVGLLAAPASAQCGPRGCPMRRQPPSLQPSTSRFQPNNPTPAWRYVEPVGHRKTIVRINCWDGGHVWSKGSGVFVRWGRRAVVLTARHVVQDAKQILIDFPGKRRCRKVRVLKMDARWDCAVLSVGDLPEGVEPAAMAFGGDASFRDGDRLETCGYGPDGRMACNSGLFRGYRPSSGASGGPTDWMVVSGPARGGDSGGPVFDEQGRVVGILWGTDGREVICVQPGRIHALLNSIRFDQLAAFDRRPTPPALGPTEPVELGGGCGPGGCPVDQAGVGDRGRTMLPWRKEAEDKDKKQDELLGRLIALEEGRAAAGKPSVDVDVSAGNRREKSEVAKPTDHQRSPLLGGLCVFVGVIGGFIIYFASQKGE
ncbi:MAG: trypsin-like peptidase domain-containing protein [Pirellulales bacterium]|nr:trypsin-like peptidase domain-containing protein [Pirellulales bacterium]